MIYIAILTAIVGLIGTGFAIREVNMKTRMSDSDTDLKRSNEYEHTARSNWGRLTKVYILTFVLMAIGWILYVMIDS